MAKNITLLGASYPDVPAVDLPQTGGGTARFVDPSPTTAQDADVGQGKIYFKSDGSQSVGTASGGGGGDYTRTEICPTTTFSVASAGGYTALLNSGRLTDATDYIVTYDGTEYCCTSRELWGSDRFLGDIALTWNSGAQSDYINPFAVEDWNGNNEPVVYARDTSSHTIKIERLDLLNSGVTLLQKSVTANGTYDPASDNADGFSQVIVNISGGASNVVTGTFKGTTTGAAMDVTLNYSGSGYPVAILIYPNEGPYNSSSGSFYNTVQRYAAAFYSFAKSEIDTSPTYASTGSNNTAVIMRRYKNSSSNATAYAQTSSSGNIYQDVNASDGGTAGAVIVKIRSKTKMSVYIAGTSYGFMANIDYKYWVLYSS